ncbi:MULTISPECIES: ABC-2 family transporter protein [Vagococcus]|uniref:Daunorubicin resistance transmembrane protein n=1 Tax=Vagococcus fluvialis bH819 TaxID=1255619 RepID=A0A1X6WP48_9ENTE|nr:MULTISPECIES: ABC-2 family transporter protein [Vagococcus]SLM86103.1 Daunorubicin resistance transmembrane protein [Vagococcus fluvialis bH819]HCM90352.1 hypothetical protein [Vagococcus sp.]
MKKGLAYYRFFLKSEAQYRINFISYLLRGFIQLVAVLFIWNLVYSSTDDGVIEGLTYQEIILYTIISMIATQFMELDNDFQVAGDIQDGNLAYELVRPVSYIWKLFFQGLARATTSILIIGIPTMIGVIFYITQQEAFSVAIIRALLFLLIISISVGLMFCVNLLFGYSAFYLNYSWGFLLFKGSFISLLSGALFPLAMLPESIRGFFLKTPFQYLSYFPTMVFLGKLSTEEIITNLTIQIVWLGIFAGLCLFFWRHAIKNITINGG